MMLPQPYRYVETRKTLKQQVEELEAWLVKDALHRHRWNRSKAAKELGLSRVGLSNKLRRYGLTGGDPE
jgi:two-component system response regulator HupR/HoxA